MDLINKEASKMTIELFKKSPSFDQDVLISLQGLTDEDVFFHLYSNMLAMDKYNKGIYNLKSIEEFLDSTAKASPEGKVIKAYAEYLAKKASQSESFDKIPYLKSIEVFFNWLSAEVNFVKAK
jgi:hypothetical protein